MSDDCEPPTVRDIAREEHVNWVYAMECLNDAMAETQSLFPGGETITVNDIPRETFSIFEEAIRDWASSFVRLGTI